jgi:4-hydroxy-tetrahydrodipicolinate reductase
MGRQVAELAAETEDVTVAAGCDCRVGPADFPVYERLSDVREEADVLVDFSSAAALPDVLAFCTARKMPVLLAATGYSEADGKAILDAARTVPVFRSANMSLGVNVLADLVRRACALLGTGYDVEIVEMHHNRKLDAPSGTAIMLADAISGALPEEPVYVYDRHSRRQKRDKKEIGISSVRGGTIVGDHEVIFAGKDEVVTLKHTALSRDIFAVGAVKAAQFISAKENGMYSMDDMIGE